MDFKNILYLLICTMTLLASFKIINASAGLSNGVESKRILDFINIKIYVFFNM